MIPIVSIGEMRQIDEGSIGADSMSGYVFMDRAGKAVADKVIELLCDVVCGPVALICGKGNNGGDGYVAARYLTLQGQRVVCFAIAPRAEHTPLSLRAYDEFIACSGECRHISSIEDLCGLSDYSCIVDAILGTGSRGTAEGLLAEIISAVNAAHVPVVAIDVPTGVTGDTGTVLGSAIRASCTVTLGLPKIGMFFYPARSHCGNLSIADLGYPSEVVSRIQGGMYFPTHEYVKSLMPLRKPDGSKFDHGNVLMICGSRRYTGCAVLCSSAALRSGCGVVTLGMPHSALRVANPKLMPEVIALGLSESRLGALGLRSEIEIIDVLHKKKALCVGPGLTHSEEASFVIREIVRNVSAPLVLDADGLNAFIGKPELVRKQNADIVITPHKGEWERLFGTLPIDPLSLISRVRMHAACRAITIVLKGSPTIVAQPSGRGFILPVGNSGMATAGSGDVLSGIIVSLISQGATPSDAAVLGVYLHGAAGDLAAQAVSEYSLVASDIISFLPKAIINLLAE